jgi:phosphonate ABC transporter permease subunit PhnE
MKKPKPSLTRSLLLGLFVVVAILVLAYGFQVTNVNFEKTRSEQRLTQLQRIIRALAHPDIIEYEQAEVFVEAPIWMPCPAGEIEVHEPDTSGAYIVLDPPCAEAGDFIDVEGYNFLPGLQGPLNFMPPSGVSLKMGTFAADGNGYFKENVPLPKRQPVEEAQFVSAIARQNVGTPKFTGVAKATWAKIVETVFLALLATIFGTMLAIPVSFLAARNLMSDVKSPLTSVALMLLGWPIGIAASMWLMGWITQASDVLTTSVTLNVVGLVISPAITYGAARWAFQHEEGEAVPSTGLRIVRLLAMFIAAMSAILAVSLLTSLMYTVGLYLAEVMGALSFVGYFIAQFGDMIRMITPVLVALTGGAIVGGLGSNLGLLLTERLPVASLRIVNFILMALAGALIFGILGAGIHWLYQFSNPTRFIAILAGVGALLGGLLSLRYGPKDLLPLGYTIYYIIRTILNATRSIEPLVMVIIFVVWVGIGPFAGALALALHTIASLSKLYSEQVESIQSGPLEAVTATGANRIQTIVYAVVPQIIPPYISFTMYRWDINVRMSTIIGFAGGGGIGFLLQQNINLLNYRAAAVQMLAIAIVVASMDYISSVLRERFV